VNSGGVATPLDFAREREVVKGQHILDHGNYLPDPNFKPSEYPRWMHKESKKSKIAANEEEELVLIEAGFSTEPPKQKVAIEEED
jgi:hypothetical protein